jgi:ectoine hydroxylase-related dioxygenase (phytanoyl-CoA dioxygenase family)
MARMTVTTPSTISAEVVERFDRDGFVQLRDVLDRETLARHEAVITAKVVELNTQHLPLEERSTYDRAFLQVMNLWRHSDAVRELVFDATLARIATELLQVDGVRLYHDQALYKEPSGGITPWHVDQQYWPLSSDRTVTAWIPLQDTPLEMGPLAFARGSHRFDGLRDSGITDESERLIEEALRGGDYPYANEPYALGDVSFHLGWTFHRAPANQGDRPRKVMTMIYMDKDIRAIEPENDFQRADLEQWLGGTPAGEVPSGELNPVLYERA